jgi:hypothetical protein
MAHTACLVGLIGAVNGCSTIKKPWKTGTSSGHITNLKQSIFIFQYLLNIEIFSAMKRNSLLYCLFFIEA